MRIAVIADTHDHLPSALLDALQTADEIWHLGDVCLPETLAPLRALSKPLYIVRGNRDTHATWPWTIDFDRQGFTIRLIHARPPVPPEGINLLFHGHTHLPLRERIGETECFNPGSAGGLSKAAPPSWAWLTLKEGCPIGWEIVAL